ncbi:MAG: response regulator [Chloroflexota bacterium]|nr:response regulator [Chloroflexota bacterium]
MGVPMIAVIEVNPMLRLLMDEILTEATYETQLWLNDEPPLNFIQRHQPDLVILELWLGSRGEGLALLLQLRCNPDTTHIPLIVCSSDVYMLQEQAALLRLVGCEILVKPFNVAELCAKIARLVQ